MDLRPDANSLAAADDCTLDRLLVDRVTDYAIFRLDTRGHVQSWNAGAERIKGYTADEIIGRHFSVFHTPEDIAAHKPERELEIASRTGRHEEEAWRVRKDGSRFWADVLITALRDERGELVGFAKITRDLTERRSAEEAVRQAAREAARRAAAEEASAAIEAREAALRAMFEQAAVGIGTVDFRSLRWLEVNPALCRMLGYTREELLARTGLDVTYTEDRENTRDQLERAAAGGAPGVLEQRYVRSNGDVVWGRVSISAVRDATGAPQYALGVIADISREKVAEAHRQEFTHLLRERAWEEHTLRVIAQQLTASFTIPQVMQQVADGVLAVSDAMSAYIEQVITPQREVEVVAVSGEHTPPVGQRVPYPGSLTEEIIERGEPVFLTRMEGLGRAMAPYLAPHCEQCSVLVVPLLADHDVLGAVVLLQPGDQPPFERSVIDRTRILGDLASLAVKRLMLIRESEARREQAEQATRSRDEVLAIVAHDLRNPLHTMMMSARLIAEIGLSGDALRQQLAIIERSGDRMNRLIRDLLDLSQIEAGHLSILRRDEDPGEVVREACAAFEAVARQREQTIVCAIPADVPRVCVDRDRLVQALSNYAGNALKFTPEHGKITVGVAGVPDGVLFCVEDNGPGIAPDQLPHVFDRFWQARRTAHLGAGLGLAIAKGIAEAHGGRVWAESELGRGSTFYLLVPAESPL